MNTSRFEILLLKLKLIQTVLKAINPKDTNTFASACLDRTVKIWSFGSGHPNYTLEAHETKGVNHVDCSSPSLIFMIWFLILISLQTIQWQINVCVLCCLDAAMKLTSIAYLLTTSDDQTVKIWYGVFASAPETPFTMTHIKAG